MLPFGIDFLDLWRRKLSLRRLFLLLHELPGDAPLFRAMNETETVERERLLLERAAAYAS